MKKIIFFLSTIILLFSITNIGFANMAAPKKDDVSTNITFEKNEDISVLNEVLNIKIENEFANIEAIYTMKNNKNENITTESMFISPNIEGEKIILTKNDQNIDYTSKSYYIKKGISTNDWQYIILEPSQNKYDIKVQTINFKLSFSSLEEAIIKVKYKYSLGGYPSLSFNSRYGSLYYYLTPAATWKNFSKLTINLELSKQMPKIKYSNLDFKKVSNRVYIFESDQLPENDLIIKVGLNSWQAFWLQFRNPYMRIFFMPIIIFISILTLIITTLIFAINRFRKKRLK